MHPIRTFTFRLVLALTTLLPIACTPETPAVQPRAGSEGLATRSASAAEDPLALLEAADEALLRTRWLEYDFEYVATHAGRGRLRGRARVEPVDRDLTRSRYWIEADMDMPIAWLADLPTHVTVARDESLAWRIDRLARSAEIATPPDGLGWSPTINLANMVLFPQLFRERPMGVEIDDPVEHRWAGTARIGEVECDVVFLVFEPESGLGEQYFYLGREDHLPRRIILTNVHDTPMGPPMSFDLTLTHLRAGAGDAPFSFTPDLERGFQIVDRDLETWRPGSPTPEWELIDLEGRTVTSEDLEGNVVVLEFWATWCPTCRLTLPRLEALQQEFADRPVRVFAVQTWDESDPRPYLAEHELDLEVLLSGDALADRLKVYGTSQNVVIDPRGRIVLHDLVFPLAQREERLAEAVREALGAPDEGDELPGS